STLLRGLEVGGSKLTARGDALNNTAHRPGYSIDAKINRVIHSYSRDPRFRNIDAQPQVSGICHADCSGTRRKEVAVRDQNAFDYAIARGPQHSLSQILRRALRCKRSGPSGGRGLADLFLSAAAPQLLERSARLR